MAINGVNYNPYLYTGAKAALNSAVNSYQYASNPNFTGDEFARNSVQNASINLLGELKSQLEETREKQGFIGKLWDGFKNLTHIGVGSNKVENAIEKLEKGVISEEEAIQALEKYKTGQKQCVDMVADIAAGITAFAGFSLAVGAGIAAAPFSGGASLGLVAMGFGAAFGVGAITKTAVKGIDAAVGGRKYGSKDLFYDVATGGINGLFAPITAGIGGAAGKAVATRIGVKTGEEILIKESLKGTIRGTLAKTFLTTSVNYTGGTLAARGLCLATDMAINGAVSGAVDSSVRYLAGDEENKTFEGLLQNAGSGAIGGFIMAPVIGGGMRLAGHGIGKAANNLNRKMTFNNVMPEGVETAVKQGTTGDCHVVSMVDGMLHNPETASLIKKAISTTHDGNYRVTIGDNIVNVARDSIPEGLLSDVQGVRILEQAYKQINGGDLEGGFAEAVAKQFGLDPVHILNADLSDDVIRNIAKEQGSLVLSAGVETGGQRHYLSVRNIDVEKGIVTLVDPVDTLKIIEKSFADFRSEVISLDGGSLKNVDLPSSVRTASEVEFYGKRKSKPAIDRTDYNKAMAEKIKDKGVQTNLSVNSTEEAAKLLKQKGGAIDKYIASMLEEEGLTLNNVTRKKVRELLCKYIDENLDVYSYDRISRILKEFDQQISGLGEGTVFFRPEEGKSYDILMALYKKQNPAAKFVTNINELKGCKNVVIIDDCSVSGNSLIDLYQGSSSKTSGGGKVVLKDILSEDAKVQAFFLTTFDEGLERIKTKLGPENVSINQGTQNKINIHYSGESKSILPESMFYKSLSIEEKSLLSSFLQIDAKVPRTLDLLSYARANNVPFGVKQAQGYQHSGTAILFDYMAPNNNSPFSSLMFKNLYVDKNIELPLGKSGDKIKVKIADIAIKEPGNYFVSANGSAGSQIVKLEHYIDAYDKFADELVRLEKISNRSAFDSEILLMMLDKDELSAFQKMLCKIPA